MNKVRLNNIAEIIMGQSPESEFVSFKNIGLPLLNGPAEFTDKYPIPVQYTSQAKRVANPSDILFCVRGSTTGRMNIADQKYAIGRGLASISHRRDPSLTPYIKALIEVNLKKLLGGTLGSVFPNLTKDNLFDLECYIHTDDDQQKIASVLSALDDKIELNNKINAELEAMAKTLYDYWFVQFDFPNKEGKPYKSSGGRMVYNKVLKREIPEGWVVENLFNVCAVQYGFPFSTDHFNEDKNGVPVIRIRDILENSISIYSTQNSIDDKYKIGVGDILVGMDGNFHINFWSQDNCYLNQRVVKLKETILPSIYLKHQIEPFIKAREKSVSRTTVGHLSDKDLKSIHVIIPSENCLSTIKSIFGASLSKIISAKKQNQELAQLRDWLLPMLMNGQVKANYNSDSDNDERSIDTSKEMDMTVESRSYSDRDSRFEAWLSQQGLAARGDIDTATLREIFDAMDDDDK